MEDIKKIEVQVTATQEVNELNLYTGEKKPYYPAGKNHQLDTIDAIAELVKFRGSKEGTLIFYNESGAGIIIDDRIMNRPQDKGNFKFSMSEQWKEWKKVIETILNQRQFVDFLKLREFNEVIDLDKLLGQIQFISFGTLINGDFNYEDKNNITMIVKIKDTETTAKIPQQIFVNIPLVFGSDQVVGLEIQLDLDRPTNENSKPIFKLTCPKFNRYWKVAIEFEVNRLKELLPGYQIISGSIGSRE